MTTFNVENVNVTSFESMPTPESLHALLPLTDAAGNTVTQGREALRDILERRDPRLFVVVGPCSIHDPAAGLDYARRLKKLQEEVKDTLLLVMRVYFEKPRTTTGWKGYINDPDMDDSFHIERGMANARRFLLFARDQTRCEADAHDVLQDALVESWRRHGDAPPPDALVFATIRRRAIDLGRRTDRREQREHGIEWFVAPDETGLDAELDRAVKGLPPNLREVVVLKVWSGLTFQQVADTLGIPLNTAASRYRYALDHLRDALKEVQP